MPNRTAPMVILDIEEAEECDILEEGVVGGVVGGNSTPVSTLEASPV